MNFEKMLTMTIVELDFYSECAERQGVEIFEWIEWSDF
jgi:hypothetical protein